MASILLMKSYLMRPSTPIDAGLERVQLHAYIVAAAYNLLPLDP